MGGNALRHFGIETIRLDREDYVMLEEDIIFGLNNMGVKAFRIPFYREKASFGDLDCVAQYDETLNLREIIQNAFKPQKISVNDGVFTFDYKNFQCDVICRKKDDLPCVINYLSWNDLHNLIGRTAHHMGLNHGWQGLRFPIRQKLFEENVNDSSDHVIETLTLSKNPQEIIEFLGYDWWRLQEGFDTLEDIFVYAVSTPFFCGKNFKLENLTHQNKTRNRKRSTFMGFLKWLEDHPENDKNYDLGRKRDWIDRIDEKWPIKDRIEKCRIQYLKHKHLSRKFNGNIVMELFPELKGKELGAALGSYKSLKGDWALFLEKNTPDQIKLDFLEFYNKLGYVSS